MSSFEQISNVAAGTITRVEGGSIVVTAGTVGDLNTVGTVGVLNNGTLNIVKDGTVSLVKAGTMTAVNNLVKGTITRVEGGTLNNLVSGSVVVTAGTVIASNGSVVIKSGTLTTGSLSNLATLGTITNLDKGTITAVSSVTNVVAGTLSRVGTILNVNTGTLAAINNMVKGTVTRVEGGSILQTAGTMTTGSLSNIATIGTIQNIVGGTLSVGAIQGTFNEGTINEGTFRQDMRPTDDVTSFGTLGTASGSLFGTLSAASGAGTHHLVSGLSVVVQTGTTDVRVLVGTAITGAGVLAAGKFVPSAGIQRDFNPPILTGTNTELTYHFVGAGTAFITVQYAKPLT